MVFIKKITCVDVCKDSIFNMVVLEVYGLLRVFLLQGQVCPPYPLELFLVRARPSLRVTLPPRETTIDFNSSGLLLATESHSVCREGQIVDRFPTGSRVVKYVLWLDDLDQHPLGTCILGHCLGIEVAKHVTVMARRSCPCDIARNRPNIGHLVVVGATNGKPAGHLSQLDCNAVAAVHVAVLRLQMFQ